MGLKVGDQAGVQPNFCPTWLNPEWTRKFLDPSKILVPKLQTTISPKLFKAYKRFIARSKDNNQGFQINFATLAPDFTPKRSTSRVSHCISVCFNTCWGHFDPILISMGLSGHKQKLEKRKICAHFLIFCPFSWFRRHQVNIPRKGVQCYVILSENIIFFTVSWCLQKVSETNLYEFDPNVHLGLM